MRKHLVALIVLLLGAGISAVLWMSGETRFLELLVSLWGLPLIVATLIVVVLYFASWLRARQHRLLTRSLGAANDQARQMHRTFVGRLDHELKNPITALRMALTEVRDPAMAHGMSRQLERMASLVTELRKISEIDEYPLANESVDLKEIVDEVLEVINSAGREVVITFPKAPRPLPPARGDRDLVFLAIYNIFNNAVKYSTPGATLEITGSEDRGMAVIDIADTGCGIPAAEVSQVWEELARGSQVRHIPGSGLGLPMVAAVLRRLDGNCELSSIEGRGTKVRIRLPLHS